MVCQGLALIMGFVSVCLRKWHARVHWLELASVAMCLCARQVAHVCEKKKTYMGDYISITGWGGRLYAFQCRQIHFVIPSLLC